MKSLPRLLAIFLRKGAWAVFFIATVVSAEEPKSSRKLLTPDEIRQNALKAYQEHYEAVKVKVLNAQLEAIQKKHLTFDQEVAAIRELDKLATTLEQGGMNFTTPRMAIYEAELHTAEKIKAQVGQADAKAKVLLKGGAPSQVTGSQPLPKMN